MWRHVTGLGLPGYARLAFWNWNVTLEISGPLGDERGFSWNSPGLHTAPRNAPDLGVSQVRIVVLRPCLRAGWLWPSVRCLLPLTPAQALIVAALGRPSPQRRRGPRYFPHAPSMARMTATGPGLPLPRAGCGILAPNHMGGQAQRDQIGRDHHRSAQHKIGPNGRDIGKRRWIHPERCRSLGQGIA